MKAKLKNNAKLVWIVALVLAIPAVTYAAVHELVLNVGQKNQTQALGSAAVGICKLDGRKQPRGRVQQPYWGGE